MRVRLGALALVATLAGCGGSDNGSESARHLDPRSDAVVALDLDYDGGNWQQIKRLYERSVAASGREDRGSRTRSTRCWRSWRARPGSRSTVTSGRC